MKKMLIMIFSISILTLSSNVLADLEGRTFSVDLPRFKGVYTSDLYYKKYTSKQQYWNNATVSNHDDTPHNLNVKLEKSTGENSGWISIGQNSTYTFGDTALKNVGNYKINLRNTVSSIYTYYSTGIWYYSI